MSRQKQARILCTTLFGIAAAGAVYALCVRPWHLRWGITDGELSANYAGDDLLPDQRGGVTRAITINASPQQIWPWLMQIGQDRSGFYSYSQLENLVGCDMPKVERIVPEWHDRVVGEKVWFATPRHYHATAYMIAAVVEPDRSLVLASPKDWERIQAGGRAQEGTWSFFFVLPLTVKPG